MQIQRRNLFRGNMWFAVLLVATGTASYGVDFEKDVFPIFESRCLECHDTETLKGGIGLETFYHAHQPTDSGEALIQPGEPEESVVLLKVQETDPEHRMPPKGDPLTKDQVATLRKWIEEGANWPDDGWRPPVHWSYVAPKLPSVPQNGGKTEIDRFIVRKLEEVGLSLNPETEPARLIRRLYLDTVGLPASVAQVQAFEKDPSPEHYEKIVDKLLASEHFGEKWAIQWLDLARYADSEGYQRDAPRSMWPWRDWVINAINADVPYDQFTIEQLAGDLLANATEEQKVASGFHRNTPLNLEAGTDPNEDHYKQLVDRVNTTSTIWLGTTMGCAQCHNHKYDPISTTEYYQLYAFFNNTPLESKQQGKEMGMSGMKYIGPVFSAAKSDADKEAEKRAAAEFETYLEKSRKLTMEAVNEKLKKAPESKEDIAKNLQKILDNPDDMSLEDCNKLVKGFVLNSPGLKVHLEKADQVRARLQVQRDKSVRVMEEMETPRETFVAKRGDFLSQGQEVSAATPAVFHPFPADFPHNRLGLAKWLVMPENPLVARTFVNRLWIEVFGQGLVATPEEFGNQGEKPTHPELLDWLAVTFVEQDAWSLKHVLKRILLSQTYRQAIDFREEAAPVDPNNQLLWRHPGQRLKAELIRDQALVISGLMNPELYGNPVRPYQPPTVWRKTAGASETYYLPNQDGDAFRRGVYTLWRRNSHYPSFETFDAPDRTSCVVQRDRSNTPLQALTLLNDPVYVQIAKYFANRIRKEGGDTLEEQIEWAFRTALARKPRESEKVVLHSAFESTKGTEGSEERAYQEIATILLNLHETVTRG